MPTGVVVLFVVLIYFCLGAAGLVVGGGLRLNDLVRSVTISVVFAAMGASLVTITLPETGIGAPDTSESWLFGILVFIGVILMLAGVIFGYKKGRSPYLSENVSPSGGTVA
jgi:hypothetical protein